MKRTVLVDGDTLVFAAAAASEYEAEWNEWLWTLHSDLQEATTKFESELGLIVDALKPDRLILALSDPLRFRPKVMPTYKGNRKGRKPVVYQALREYVQERYETYMRPWLEGDDVLGILMTHPDILGDGERICVSIDKDLKTIPGLHVNYAKSVTDIVTVTEEDADKYFMSQVLTGDRTDGYGGCPTIGPVKAEKVLAGLDGIEEMWPAVVKAYEKQGLSEEVALQNARVARILRWEDYDYQKKEVILWTP